jgi:hypothetical protein
MLNIKKITTKNMKQQSAIRWIQEALEHNILTHEQVMQTIGLFEQAVDMEKEQIMDAYGQGVADKAGEVIDVSKVAEKYYKDKYELHNEEDISIYEGIVRDIYNNILKPYGLYERSHSGYDSVVVQVNTEYTVLIKEDGKWKINNHSIVTHDLMEFLINLYNIVDDNIVEDSKNKTSSPLVEGKTKTNVKKNTQTGRLGPPPPPTKSK